MSRLAVTEKIIAQKVAKGLQWKDIAEKVGASKEWVTAACLGQMTLTEAQATTVAQIFDLSDSERKWLMQVPYKGSLPTEIPTDPLIYRLYEIVNVYGTTIKELIHEEFGDGIMSAIDFDMDIQREPHPEGDRVKITMNGKFLPYKEYYMNIQAIKKPDAMASGFRSNCKNKLPFTKTSCYKDVMRFRMASPLRSHLTAPWDPGQKAIIS